MTEKIYYIENSLELATALMKIEILIPCFIERNFIEMDYSKVVIIARNEDIATVERFLAPLV